MGDSSTTTVIKIAPNGSETRLQRYYRERVENLEAERAEIVKAVLDAAPSQEEVHKARWDLIVKQDELEEVQRALGKANLYLLDQKKLLLVLKAENESLTNENELQSRQINHLMSLLPPVQEDEITFFQDVHQTSTKENTPTEAVRGNKNRGRAGKQKHKVGASGVRSQPLTSVESSSIQMTPSTFVQEKLASQEEEIARLKEKLQAMEVLSAERARVLEKGFSFRARDVSATRTLHVSAYTLIGLIFFRVCVCAFRTRCAASN